MHVMRIFACFPPHNAQEKSRTRLSSSFSPFIEKLSISLWSSATPLTLQTLTTMSNMTYTLTASQKLTLTLQGRKAANRALWAAEKADQKALKAYTDKKARKAEKVTKRADKLKRKSIEAVYASVSQTHTRPTVVLPTKPMDTKVQSVAAKKLKKKAQKGAKDSSGRLEAQAQRHSMQMAQTRAARSVKTDVVWDEATNTRKEVEVTPQNPTKAHVIKQVWMDYTDIPEGLDMEDAVRYAALQEGYGQAADEVSMDDCL